jgi:hypothetical protein
MSPFFIALLALVASTFWTRAAQQAEIVALRHQIAVLQQSAPRRHRLRQSDRLCGFGCPVSGRAAALAAHPFVTDSQGRATDLILHQGGDKPAKRIE